MQLIHSGITFLTAAMLGLSAASASAQPESHSHGGPGADEIGSSNISFQTTCLPDTTEDFNRGVALVHSFWFAEAIAAFETVLAVDPDCAMAHWGIALSHWSNPFAGQRNAAQLERGQGAVARALSTGSPSPRENLYIQAVAQLFSDTQSGTQPARTQAYEKVMETLVAEYPEDREAWIFYALAVTQNAPPTDLTYSRQLYAAQILEPLFMEHPRHPGLAHYIIHTYDHPPLAGKALDAARRYAELAPAVPHALHMPSHTFTRVGLWQESIATNQRSAEAARQSSTAGEELHALDYQMYAYLQLAQDRAAAAVVERALALTEQVNVTAVGATAAGAFAIAAIPARYALERRAFAEAAALPVSPADTPHTLALTHFARAVGAARSGTPQAAAPDLERLAELREALRARHDTYWTEQVDIQWRSASAWVAFAEGRQEQAIKEMQQAADREDATDKAAVSPGPLAPTREQLGAMLLEAGRAEEALMALEATLLKEPNRFLTLYYAAEAADQAGDPRRSRDFYQRLLTLAEDSDTEREELKKARQQLTR